MNQTFLSVSFGVIAFNEHNYLPDLLYDLSKQTYPLNLIEIILVDGESTDDTWSIMQEFKEKNISKYKDIKVLSNSKRNQPAGWNVVIKNATSDIILRIDAHARLSMDFVENNVKCINSGEFVCGGPRINIIDENTKWKQMLLAAEQSMFGSGFASYRKKTEKRKYVKTLFHAAYKKEVIEKVGLFNECLVRTEDNEYHYRIRKAGYKICYDPSILSKYQTRNSFKGMIKQKFQNGLWIGKTLFICPKCISLFHLAPCAFVISLFLTLILFVIGIRLPLIIEFALYSILQLINAVFSLAKDKNIACLLLPIILFFIHFLYGIGTLAGIVKSI